MQYEGKVTRLSLREEYPTAISNTKYRANLSMVGFNTDFIVEHKPALAVRIMALYKEAAKLKESDPRASDEECRVAAWKLM